VQERCDLSFTKSALGGLSFAEGGQDTPILRRPSREQEQQGLKSKVEDLKD